MAKQYVSNKDESVRMFESDLLEKLTHIHPIAPHAIYVPVMGYMLYLGYQRGVGPGRLVGLFVLGALLWTAVEYVVHRFVFHVSPEVEDETTRIVAALSPGQAAIPALRTWAQKQYFVLHGVHHDFPSDSKRLVMAPAVSIPLAFAFYYGFKLVIGAVYGPSVFAGFLAGYLVYDTTHYVVHHFRLSSKWGVSLKKHHYRHHFRDSNENFGVSSPFWDSVLTTRARRQTSERS